MDDDRRGISASDRGWGEGYRRADSDDRRADTRQRDGRAYGAGDFEQSRYGRYYDMRREAGGRGWPSYDPGHDSPAYRDRSGWRGRDYHDRVDFDGWDAPWGGRPMRDRDRSPWDRLLHEGRSFFERTREEVAGLLGGDGRQDRAADGDFRGVGPRGYRRSDERIAEDVIDRLTEDPRLDASGIEVSVAGGEVTLSGQVRSRSDKRRAEDQADGVSGVTHVQNNLRVGAGGGEAADFRIIPPMP